METHYETLKRRRGDVRAFAQVIYDAVALLEIVEIYSGLESIAQRNGNLNNICEKARREWPMLGERLPKYEDIIAALKQYETKGDKYAIASDVRQDLEKALSKMREFAERKVA